MYSLGGTLTLGGANAPSSDATALLQGNYDYKTKGVAYYDGGSNHTFQASYYYTSKPSFIGSCPWPAQGSDLATVSSLSQPAYQRATGKSCGTSAPAPPPPVDVTGTVIK
jgi:hypothetical protein